MYSDLETLTYYTKCVLTQTVNSHVCMANPTLFERRYSYISSVLSSGKECEQRQRDSTGGE